MLRWPGSSVIAVLLRSAEVGCSVTAMTHSWDLMDHTDYDGKLRDRCLWFQHKLGAEEGNAFVLLDEELSRTSSCLPYSIFFRRLMACSGWYPLALMDPIWENGEFWDFLLSSWTQGGDWDWMLSLGYLSLCIKMQWLHWPVFYRLEETRTLLPASAEIKGMK